MALLKTSSKSITLPSIISASKSSLHTLKTCLVIITREKAHHRVLEQFEKLLTNYFTSLDLTEKGIPTVHYLANQLNVSPKYLSRLLKSLIGQNTQQHIHEKLIEKAKEKLSTTALSVSEIAYELGFEHSQSFSKFFKSKTNQSPLEFRTGFN